MFAWFFMIHVALYWYLYIWRSKHLLQSLQEWKTLSCQVPGLMLLSPGLQSSEVGTGSCGWCWVLIRVLSCQDYYQSIKQMWILTGPWVDKTPTKTLVSRAGTGRRVCLWVHRWRVCCQVCKWVQLPLSPWESFWEVTGHFPGWAELALDYTWDGLELSHKVHSGDKGL